jgi:kumamolisin
VGGGGYQGPGPLAPKVQGVAHTKNGPVRKGPSCVLQEKARVLRVRGAPEAQEGNTNTMMIGTRRVPVKGSERHPVPGARAAGPVDAQERVEVTLKLRGQGNKAAAVEALGQTPLSRRAYLTHAELEQRFGTSSEDMDRIEAFAEDHGLDIVRRHPASCTVVLAGPLHALMRAFGVSLTQYHSPHGAYRGRTGPVFVPEEIAPLVEGVFGLDNRPVPRARRRSSAHVAGAMTPVELARHYEFPEGTDGSGQWVAILELGGGFRPAEVKRYLSALGIARSPKMVSLSVDGAHNRPEGSPDSADAEVVMDVEIVAAAAPGANLAVYFAPNSGSGFINGVLAAVHDPHRSPAALSISWGMPEDHWTDQGRRAMDDALQSAALMGMTVCVAAGDHGTNDVEKGADPGVVHVDYPASSPYALACGGTKLEGGQEVVWNDNNGWATGGGVSVHYQTPAWQANANVPRSLRTKAPGRGVPDVSASATNYAVLVDGYSSVSGGTSAVAPLWSALVARLNQRTGKRAGYLNPLLYLKATDALKDVSVGNNGVPEAGFGTQGYPAEKGWDACTGLGVPNGEALAKALAGAAS